MRAQSYQYRRSITVDRTKVRNPALFPIAFDNVTSAKTTDAGELSKSWTHAVGSGNDKLAIVSVSSVPTAVTITADAGSSLGFTAQSSGTLGYTDGAGSNKALIVSVCIRNNTTVSSVTYGGTALSRIGAVDNTTWVRAEMWGLLNVTPQTANVVVTMSATADFVVGAVAFSNVGVRETLGICGRAYILNDGMMIAQGTPAEILANQQVRDVYLGEGFKL